MLRILVTFCCAVVCFFPFCGQLTHVSRVSHVWGNSRGAEVRRCNVLRQLINSQMRMPRSSNAKGPWHMKVAGGPPVHNVAWPATHRDTTLDSDNLILTRWNNLVAWHGPSDSTNYVQVHQISAHSCSQSPFSPTPSTCRLDAARLVAMAAVVPQHICFLCTRKFTDAAALKIHATQFEIHSQSYTGFSGGMFLTSSLQQQLVLKYIMQPCHGFIEPHGFHGFFHGSQLCMSVLCNWEEH